MILNENIERKGDLFPNKIIDYKKDLDIFYFTAENGVILQLTVMRDSVIRFRYTTANKFEDDFSYSIDKKAINGYNFLDVTEDEKIHHYYRKVIYTYPQNDLKIKIYDVTDNKLTLNDEKGFHWEESYELGSDIIKMSKHSEDAESILTVTTKRVKKNPCYMKMQMMAMNTKKENTANVVLGILEKTTKLLNNNIKLVVLKHLTRLLKLE